MFVLGLVMACFGSAVWAETTFQRSCRFELAVMSTGETVPVDLRATVAIRGGSGRVVLRNGGDFSGSAQRVGAADELAFRTDVSSEVLTMGANGDTLWTIEFDRGKEVISFDNASIAAYAGECSAPKEIR